MSRIILLPFYVILLPLYGHSAAILLVLYDMSQTYVKLTPSRAWFTVLYKQVLNYRMVLDPSFTLSAHHMHSNALSAPQVLKFAPNVYMSHVLFHVVGMLIFFCFKCQFKRLTRLQPRPSPSSAPAVLLSRPPTVRSPCCFRLPSAQSALVLRFCCCGFASSDKVRPLVL